MDERQLVIYYPKTGPVAPDPPIETVNIEHPSLQQISQASIQFILDLMRGSMYRSLRRYPDRLSGIRSPYEITQSMNPLWTEPAITNYRHLTYSQDREQPYERPMFEYSPVLDWSWGLGWGQERRGSLPTEERMIPRVWTQTRWGPILNSTPYSSCVPAFSFDEPYTQPYHGAYNEPHRPIDRVTEIPMVTITIPEALSIPNDLLLPTPDPFESGYTLSPEPPEPTRIPMSRWTIYENSENVHTSSVSSSVSQSISNLMTDPKPDFDSVMGWIVESDLSLETKELAIQFCDDDADIHLNKRFITFNQIFAYVWQRIHSFSDGSEETVCNTKVELVRILGERVNDCIDEYDDEVCITGKISRIVSTLDGFFPDIRIGISDNDQITAIILQTRDNIKPYDVAAHVSVATQNLLDAGFERAQFAAWIEALED